jgi:hypothetical protein
MKAERIPNQMKDIQVQIIKQMTANGYSSERIAEITGANPTEVFNCVKDNGFSIEPVLFSEEKLPGLLELYTDQVSVANLAIKFQMGKKRVNAFIDAAGIRRDNSNHGRKQFFNEHIFDVIDTQEKAYWLGYLFADGKSSTITTSVILLLALKQEAQMVKFAQFIGADPAEVIHRDNDRYIRLRVSSKHMTDTLAKLGLKDGKRKTLQWPPIQDDMEMHFLRGYMDGKGSLKVNDKTGDWSMTTSGTSHLCEGIQSALLKRGLIRILGKGKGSASGFSFTGNAKIQEVLDLLYADSSIHSEERYQKYQQLRERH